MTDNNNPYTPPQSNVYQPEPRPYGVNPQWDIGQVMNEAWSSIVGFKQTYFLACLIYFAISLVLTLIAEFVGDESIIIGVLTQLIIMLVTYPLGAGILMLGIKRARNEDVSPRMIFDYYPQTIPIFLLYLLMTLLIVLGLVLLILPGIYLMIAYLFALPLLVERKLGIWDALETSRKAITPYWFRFAGLVLVMVVIILLSLIPLGIGLIWTLPMFSVILGIVYRNMFGTEA